jgi:hypothetical protein
MKPESSVPPTTSSTTPAEKRAEAPAVADSLVGLAVKSSDGTNLGTVQSAADIDRIVQQLRESLNPKVYTVEEIPRLDTDLAYLCRWQSTRTTYPRRPPPLRSARPTFLGDAGNNPPSSALIHVGRGGATVGVRRTWLAT